MGFSLETEEKIKLLFKNNIQMRDRLLACDADAIREVGSIAQKGLEAEDVVAAFDSKDPETMSYLYNQARRVLELKALYKQMCLEYYQIVGAEPVTQTNTQTKRI